MRIRRLTYFDYKKIKKLVSYLCEDGSDRLVKNFAEEPLGYLNAMLPLALKFKPESFILLDGDEVLGLITTVKTPGNPYKLNITRLVFKENMYEVGKQLVEFVVHKYGAKGALNFVVNIDECHEELFDLFVNGCGFRLCSSETLWKSDNPRIQNVDLKWRYAQNSDAQEIAQLYNSELETIYRPSLSRHAKEFSEQFFAGFSDYYKTRFVLEEDKKIIGYFSITTSDNSNYIFDITLNSAYGLGYERVLDVMLAELRRKKHPFFPIVKQKKYMKDSETLANCLSSIGYYPIQTRQILVKDYYRPIRQESASWNVFNFGENCVSDRG